MTTIPLAPPLLAGSSDRPGDLDGPSNQRWSAGRLPIWSCSVRGFACHPCCHGRGALLPHLFTLTPSRRLNAHVLPSAIACLAHLRWSGPGPLVTGPLPRSTDATRRYIFCATFLRVAPTGCYPAHCPAEFGLSSPRPDVSRVERRPSGLLRRFHCRA